MGALAAQSQSQGEPKAWVRSAHSRLAMVAKGKMIVAPRSSARWGVCGRADGADSWNNTKSRSLAGMLCPGQGKAASCAGGECSVDGLACARGVWIARLPRRRGRLFLL